MTGKSGRVATPPGTRGIAFKSVWSSAVAITPLAIGARALTFVLYTFIAHRFGVQGGTDALLFALTISVAVTTIVTAPIESSVIPIYSRLRDDPNLLGGLYGFVKKFSGIGFAGALLLALAARPLVAAFTAFGERGAAEISFYCLIMAPAQLLQLWEAVLRGVANAEHRFLLAAFSLCLETSVLLGCAVLFSKIMGLTAIPLAYLASPLITCPFLLYRLRKTAFVTGLRNPTRENKSPLSLDNSRLLWFQILGTAMVSANPIIDQGFASFLGKASVTTYSYASRIFLVPVMLVLSGLSPVFLATLSKAAAENRMADFHRTVRLSLMSGAALCLLITPIFILWAPELVSIALLRPKREILPIASVFRYVVVATCPYVIAVLLLRVQIALGNYRVLFASYITLIVLNFVFDALLVVTLGLRGLALSTSLVFVVLSVFLLIQLFRENRVASPNGASGFQQKSDDRY